MTAFSVQALTRDVRRAHALITSRELSFLGELLQFLRNDRAPREKHGQARADVVIENEKIEFLAKLSMDALLRFVEHLAIIVELLFLFERRVLNARLSRFVRFGVVITRRCVR